MLDERKEKVITLLMEGNGITETAKVVGIVRQTIYDWMEQEEFKNELDKRRREIVTKANNMILNKLSTCTDQLIKIATTGKSEKVRSDTAQYLVNRVLGTPTNKVETTTNEGDKEHTSEEDILKVFESKKVD